MIRRSRHAFRLLFQLGAYSFVNRAFWVLPLVLLLLAVGSLVVVGQVAAPLIYTIF